MVMVWQWDRMKHLTRADVDMDKMPPNPYSTAPLGGSFPKDVCVKSRTKPRDFMEVGSYVFVSSKTRTILEQAQAAVEMFPVKVVYRSKPLTGWYYLHLLQELDCLDEARTVRAGPDYPFPEMIKTMAMKEGRYDAPLFRIANSPQMAVADDVAQAFRTARCTGVVFVPVDDWRNPGL